MTHDNLDGICEADVERIFGQQAEQKSLEQIHDQVGQRIMGIWIQTAYKKAVNEQLPLYQFPTFVETYIKKRYDQLP